MYLYKISVYFFFMWLCLIVFQISDFLIVHDLQDGRYVICGRVNMFVIVVNDVSVLFVNASSFSRNYSPIITNYIQVQ